MSAAGTSAIDIRGIVVNIQVVPILHRSDLLDLDLDLQPPAHNGLRHASRSPQASVPASPAVAAHAVHCDIDHEPPARPATSPGIPALRHPKVHAHCRLPRYPAQPDPAAAAPEDHRNHQRPSPSARPRLRPRQLPLELREDRLRWSDSLDHCPLRGWIAEPAHRLYSLRPSGRPLAHWLRVLHHRLLPLQACSQDSNSRHVGSPRWNCRSGSCPLLFRDKRCWYHRGRREVVARIDIYFGPVIQMQRDMSFLIQLLDHGVE